MLRLIFKCVEYSLVAAVTLVVANFIKWDELTLAEHVGMRAEQVASQPLIDVDYYQRKVKNWAKRMSVKAAQKAGQKASGLATSTARSLSAQDSETDKDEP